MKNIAVCISSDNNYVQHMAACISSILNKKNNDEFINVYIIDGGIDEENKEKLSYFEKNSDCKITYVFPKTEKLKKYCPHREGYISFATYYKLLIPELIQNEERVIYLDCDIIVRKSLWELYSKDFGENLVLAAKDVSGNNTFERLKIDKYVNTGVILMNCTKMREEKTVDRILNWVKDNFKMIKNLEQDVLNASINDRIGFVEDIYNAQVRLKNYRHFDKIEDPVILHFISPKKPWVFYKPLNYTPWEKEYFEALKNTPWDDFIEYYNKKKILYFIPNLLYPTGIVKDFIRNIFSVKNNNERSYKIITVLGLQFKKKVKSGI